MRAGGSRLNSSRPWAPRHQDGGHRTRRVEADATALAPRRVIVAELHEGQMSLVRPRPPFPREVAQHHKDVHPGVDVRPGGTGLWQVLVDATLPGTTRSGGPPLRRQLAAAPGPDDPFSRVGAVIYTRRALNAQRALKSGAHQSPLCTAATRATSMTINLGGMDMVGPVAFRRESAPDSTHVGEAWT